MKYSGAEGDESVDFALKHFQQSISSGEKKTVGGKLLTQDAAKNSLKISIYCIN